MNTNLASHKCTSCVPFASRRIRGCEESITSSLDRQTPRTNCMVWTGIPMCNGSWSPNNCMPCHLSILWARSPRMLQYTLASNTSKPMWASRREHLYKHCPVPVPILLINHQFRIPATTEPKLRKTKNQTLHAKLHTMRLSLSLLTVLLPVLTLAVGEDCGRSGFCYNPTSCIRAGGSVSLNLCPGGADNRCCTYPDGQCGTNGKGVCKYTSGGCRGTWQTGLCPGGSNYKCCVP
ncbi:hypothetical protein BDW02DRAFT_96440 [Decorospora gaudefroyi]|uniref:Uncharacterized protein n=1 Tax=Decorospora gaudefroyi TaxID=184978 RepID=A0A6A5KVS2_9PLEO|nr:hypothetical protein BDW02DRAFT_96440 [Decorospora gaudefroyi]